MAQVICCPCGKPLDCDNLDIVVTLSCPRCGGEIVLELDSEETGPIRATLTVMEGPYWVGEQFILPVGAELTIGSDTGNWLSLDGDAIAGHHCRLLVSRDGKTSVEDLGSPSGTWIGEQRIVKGQLHPRQSFRVGEFRLRLDLQSTGSSWGPAPASLPAKRAERQLPTMERISGGHTPGGWLISHRFQVGRWLVLAFGWLTAVYYVGWWVTRPQEPWSWSKSIVVGGAMVVAMSAAGRRVTLLHPHYKYVSLGVVAVLVAVSTAWGLFFPAVALLLLAVALGMLIGWTPSANAALGAAFIALVAATLMVAVAAGSIRDVIAAHG